MVQHPASKQLREAAQATHSAIALAARTLYELECRRSDLALPPETVQQAAIAYRRAEAGMNAAVHAEMTANFEAIKLVEHPGA